MKDYVYFDNAATTKICEAALNKFNEVNNTVFGNPSSSHSMGVAAQNELNKSRKIISLILNTSQNDIYFSSCATESNNIAVIGSCMANNKKRNHIITSEAEHSSVLKPVKYLAGNGFDVSYIKPNENLNYLPDDISKCIKKETLLVSLMHVNNETGAINNIKKIGAQIKSIDRNIIFHVDASASFCKIDTSSISEAADIITLSGHKIHAGKGCGAIYLKNGIKISPLIFGGGQEKNLKPGTENVPAIAAFAEASMFMNAEIKKNYDIATNIRSIVKNGLLKKYGNIITINESDINSPYILSVSFKGCKSEILMNALENFNIYVSSGAACNSNSNKNNIKNSQLYALGFNDDQIATTIRISFSKYNTEEEAYFFLECIEKSLTRFFNIRVQT